MATIKDIARELQVSISTVSYALNGGPRSVPEEVRLQVLEVAERLNYRPNRLAKSLVTRRSGIIGVVATRPVEKLIHVPYFSRCFNGIVNAAETVGYDVLVFTSYGTSTNTLLDGRADGLVIMVPPKESPTLQKLTEMNFPYVLISSDEVSGVPTVTCDNDLGVRLAIDHLYALGHRRIGHVTGLLDIEDGRDRCQAFHDAAADLGLSTEFVVEGDFTPNGGYLAGLRMLQAPTRPTAIFCANDEMAAGLYEACRHLGLDVPRDLSIIGFDDAVGSNSYLPGFTTISQPLTEMGNEAIVQLAQVLAGKSASGKRFSPELVVRNTTSAPRMD